MALQPIKITCDACGHRSTAQPIRTFLGFQKVICPACQEQLIYPLTSGYRTTYFIFACLILISIVINLSNGQIGFPGVIGIAMLYALFRDWKIRRNID